MKKESKTDKLIKRYFGILGPLDEFRRSEIGKASTYSLVWLQLILSITCAIAFFVAPFFPETGGHYYPFVVLLFVIIAGQGDYYTHVARGVHNYK